MRCVRTKWKVQSCFTHVRVVLTLQSVDEMLKCDSSDVIEHKCSRWDVRERGGGGGEGTTQKTNCKKNIIICL